MKQIDHTTGRQREASNQINGHQTQSEQYVRQRLNLKDVQYVSGLHGATKRHIRTAAKPRYNETDRHRQTETETDRQTDRDRGLR